MICIRHIMLRLKILAPKLVDLETAFVYIEMDIALLKIRCTGLPDNRFGVECFYCLPCTIADALTVFFGQSKKNFQFIMMRVFIDFQNHTANIFAIHNDTIQIAQIVKMVLDTSLLNEDGSLREESQKSLTEGTQFLDTFNV